MAIIACVSSGWLLNVACRVNHSTTKSSGAAKSRSQVPMALSIVVNVIIDDRGRV